MEVKFNRKSMHYLRPFFSQVHTQEQTQEIRLPDTYPDIGKVLGCWGQVLMRGKEWRSTSMGANGGVMAWVMYAPEDGTQPRVVDTWIPLQSRWDFQEPAEDGTMILQPMVTDLDSRGISARKIMVRACVDTFAQAMRNQSMEIAAPSEVPEDVQLLSRSYPVELPMEAGEKQVQIEDVLTIPGNLPAVQKMVRYNMTPTITEQKVLGNRLVFRGVMDVHMMYLTEDGIISHWQEEVPFAQFTELDRDYAADATAWVLPIMTAMELELTENQQLQLKAGIAVQYVIFDRSMLEVIEDAFSPCRDVTPVIESVQLPVILDSTSFNIPVEGRLNGNTERIIHAESFGEYPTFLMAMENMNIHMDGQFQALYRDMEGHLTGEAARFEGTVPFQSAPENQVLLWVGRPTQPEILQGGDGVMLQCSYPVTTQVYSGQSIPVVTELELGEKREPDPKRPSIILRRVGDEDLWSIAKGCGSTVAAIREANQLSGEPESGQMLLIPVC